MMNIEKLFFTSDTHWHHKNIIKFANRGFYDLFYMNEALIDNWNKKIPKDGVVYHLGDFALTGNIEKITDIVKRLNGKIHLIFGNHDYQNRFNREIISSLFESTNDMLYLKINDKEIGGVQGLHLCHYPLLTWNNKVRGSWNLHGHIHSGPKSTGSERDLSKDLAQYDVGVDNNNFTPISYNEIKTILTKRYLGNGSK